MHYDQMEERRRLFAKSELAKFFHENSGIYLCDIDDIVIDYMVSVIEEIGSNPYDAETDFDVDQFTEMISQSIDGFDEIKSVVIFDWLFDLGRRIEDGSYKNSPINLPEKSPSPTFVQNENEDRNEDISSTNDINTVDGNQSPRSISVDIPNSLKWLCSSHEPSSSSLFDEHNNRNMDNINDMLNVINLNSQYDCSNPLNELTAGNTVQDNNNRNNMNSVSQHDPYSLFRDNSPPSSLFGERRANSPTLQLFDERGDSSPTLQLFDATDNDLPIFSNEDGVLHTQNKRVNTSERISEETAETNASSFDGYTTIRSDSPSDDEDNNNKNDSINFSHQSQNSLPLFKIHYKTSSIKISTREKIEKMKELFPHIPETQLRKCLNRFKGILEKAIQYLVGQQKKDTENNEDEDNDETEETTESQILVDSRTEAAVAQLKDIFPDQPENLIRECLLTVGNDLERATQMLLSEDLSDLLQKNKFQIHHESSKRRDLSPEEASKLKKSLVQKYGYSEVKIVSSGDKPKRAKNKISRNNSFQNESNIVALEEEKSALGEEKSTPKSYRKKRSR